MKPFVRVLLPDGHCDIQAFAFDKDGTLLDSLGFWAELTEQAVHAYLTRFQPQLAPALLQQVNVGMLKAVGVASGRADRSGALARGTVAGLIHTLHASLVQQLPSGTAPHEALFRERYLELAGELIERLPQRNEPLPGAEDTLHRIHAAGIPLALITADNEDHSIQEMEQQLWMDYFSALYFGDSQLPPKPAPEALFDFSRTSGVPLSKIAMVGDTETDFQCARNAGAALFIEVHGSLEALVPRLTSGASFPTIDAYGRERTALEIHRIL